MVNKEDFLSRYVTDHGKPARYTHYSRKNDVLYFLPCAFFVPKDDRYLPKSWTSTGYRNWHKIVDQALNGCGIKAHIVSSHHISSLEKTDNFQERMKGNVGEVESPYAKTKALKIKNNSTLITAEINILRTLSKQGVPIRGHDEVFDSKNKSKNRGNLLTTFDLVRKYNLEIDRALKLVEEKQVTGKGSSRVISMLSPRIQNELIEVMGSEVQKIIIDKVKEAKFYVIISDECSVGNKQYLSLCLRYVDKATEKIKEDFVSYMLLDGADSQSIFTKLVEEL